MPLRIFPFLILLTTDKQQALLLCQRTASVHGIGVRCRARTVLRRIPSVMDTSSIVAGSLHRLGQYAHHLARLRADMEVTCDAMSKLRYLYLAPSMGLESEYLDRSLWLRMPCRASGGRMYVSAMVREKREAYPCECCDGRTQ